ncbi:unnamed protein product [Lactuca saligna]|uniref:Protein kinase domain-containing protein n=1 Tax=Lactuca saligna TaxID=75948 RepID=A0AA36ECW3_LACSI|nr:unnamed protein product [Lactuca saligna]
MENGSLVGNLYLGKLIWETRFENAKGTAKGDRIGKSIFSTVRETQGYMAPEWVFNLPITSKVNVFSYGVVILEMITGRTVGKIRVCGGDLDTSLDRDITFPTDISTLCLSYKKFSLG